MYTWLTHRVALGVCLLVSLVWITMPAGAQVVEQAERAYQGIGIDQRLGAVVPGDLVFRNEDGEDVALKTYLDGDRPVLLTLVYHSCPMLCNTMLNGLTNTLADMAWTPGDEFEVLTVSFNAIDTAELARRQKARYVAQLGNPEAASGWHFLTGDEASINTLTETVGFNYRWVEEQQEYAHPAALIVLNGEGTITRYLPGLANPAREVRASLVEASEGKIGTVLDQAFLYCFQFDPEANAYVLHAFNAMRVGGVLTMLVLGMMLFMLWRRESKRPRPKEAGLQT